MNQLNVLQRFWKNWKKNWTGRRSSTVRNLYHFVKLIPLPKFELPVLKKLIEYLSIYCFLIRPPKDWKNWSGLFSWNTSLYALYYPWSQTKIKNIWYSLFSLPIVISIQNDRMDFFYECHKQQTSTCKISFVVEVLRFEKLAFEYIIIFAKRMLDSYFSKLKKPGILRNYVLVFTINSLLDKCYFVKRCSVNRFLLFEFSDRNRCDRS